MASSKQTSFTVFPLVFNAVTRRFWRGLGRRRQPHSIVLGQPPSRVQRRWTVVLLGMLTLLLTLVSVPSSAQTPPSNSAAEAPVVLDGRVLFKVRNFGNFTAADRAEIGRAHV